MDKITPANTRVNIKGKLLNLIDSLEKTLSCNHVSITLLSSVLNECGILDSEYYLKKYNDIADSGVDPAIHFVKHGYKEDRYPSAWCENDDVYVHSDEEDSNLSSKTIIQSILDHYLTFKNNNTSNNIIFLKSISALINSIYDNRGKNNAFHKWAEIESHRENYIASLAHWIGIIKCDPTDAEAYKNIIYIYEHINNDKDKAENVCRLAIENNVLSKDIYISYAKIAMHKRAYQDIYDRWIDIRSKFNLDGYDKNSLLLLTDLLDFFKKEEYCSGNEEFKTYVSSVQNIIDEMYVKGCDGILKIYSQDEENRVPILGFDSLGDSFFTMSALDYINKKTGKLYSLIVPMDSEIKKMADLYMATYPGTEKYFIFTEHNLYHWFIEASKPIQKKYAGKMICITDDEYNPFFVRKTTEEIKRNLTSLNIHIKDEQYYIEKYNIDPGNTILIIPNSNWHKSLPDYFWQMSINFYSFIGLKVLINSKDKEKFGDKAEYIYPSIIDIVCIAKLCKAVLAIRTGLSEFLAVVTNTPMTIISHEKEFVTDWYPNLDNSDGHLKEFHIDNVRTSGFSFLDSRIDSLLKPYANIKISDKFEFSTPLEFAKLYTSYARENFHIFDEDPVFLPYDERFCDADYQQQYKDGNLYFRFSIKPRLEYDIYLGLRNNETHEIEQSLYHVQNNTICFKIYNNGTYSIFVKFFHPIEKHLCARFETKPLSVANSWREKIKLCRDYDEYIDLVAAYRNYLIIFIASRDTVTDNDSDTCLGLNRLMLSLIPEKKFRSSYVAVIDGGIIKAEINDEESDIKYNYDWNNNNARITSTVYDAVYNYSPPILININNEEYAVNSRGLNIVVWDKEFNYVLDSVVFDTYAIDKVCYKINDNL